MNDPLKVRCHCNKILNVPVSSCLKRDFCGTCGEDIKRLLLLKYPKTVLDYLEETEKKVISKPIRPPPTEMISLERLKYLQSQAFLNMDRKEFLEATSIENLISSLHESRLIALSPAIPPFHMAKELDKIGWIVIGKQAAVSLYLNMEHHEKGKAWLQNKIAFSLRHVDPTYLKNFSDILIHDTSVSVENILSIAKSMATSKKKQKILYDFDFRLYEQPASPALLVMNPHVFLLGTGIPSIVSNSIGIQHVKYFFQETFGQLLIREMAAVSFDACEFLEISESDLITILTNTLKQGHYKIDKDNYYVRLEGPDIKPLREKIEKELKEEEDDPGHFDENKKIMKTETLDFIDLTIDDVFSIMNSKLVSWIIKKLRNDSITLNQKPTSIHAKTLYRKSHTYTYEDIVNKIPYKDYISYLKRDILEEKIGDMVSIREKMWINVCSYDLTLMFLSFREEIREIFGDKNDTITEPELVTCVLFSELNNLEFECVIKVLKFRKHVGLYDSDIGLIRDEEKFMAFSPRGIIGFRGYRGSILMTTKESLKQDISILESTTLDFVLSLVGSSLKGEIEERALSKLLSIFTKKEHQEIRVYLKEREMYLVFKQLGFIITFPISIQDMAKK